MQTKPVVTTSSTPTPLNVVTAYTTQQTKTVSSSPKTLNVVTVSTSLCMTSTTTVTSVSTITTLPSPPTPTLPFTGVTGTTRSPAVITSVVPSKPLSMVTLDVMKSSEDKSLSMVTATFSDPITSPYSNQAQSRIDTSSATELPTSYRYYDVLTPEEDDIISISHHELMERQCNVMLDHLDPSDITEIKQSLRPTSRQHAETMTDTQSDFETEFPVKKKRESHCPLRQPSKSRIDAQKKLVQETNK